MRATLITTISIVVIAAFLAALFATWRQFERTRAPVRDLSRMMAVRHTISEALSAHQQKHGTYPRSLTELPLHTLTWGDEGSSAQDLTSWSYTSDGPNFTMTWTNALGTGLSLEGKNGRIVFDQPQPNGKPPF